MRNPRIQVAPHGRRTTASAFTRLLLAAHATVVGMLASVPAGAQDFEILHAFTAEAGRPVSLFVEGDGRIYATTLTGGRFGAGSVVVLTPNGEGFDQADLWEFSGVDGEGVVSLVRGGDGNLYGATWRGGTSTNGTLFRIDSAGLFTTLYNFSSSSLGEYTRSLLRGADGSVYGITGVGAFLRVEPAGGLTVLRTFGCSDGGAPMQLFQAADGYFYGTTTGCGTKPIGTFFRIDSAGVLTLGPVPKTNTSRVDLHGAET